MRSLLPEVVMPWRDEVQPWNSVATANEDVRASTLDMYPELEATTGDLPAVAMHPELLMAIRSNQCKKLENLLNGGDRPTPQPTAVASQGIVDAGDGADEIFVSFPHDTNASSSSSSATPSRQSSAAVLADGVDQSASLLLEGVTMEGNSALHEVARKGSCVTCSDLIYEKARHLLDAPNKRGETPLHCAAKAGNTEAVCHLIDLAKREEGGNERARTVLSKQNKRGETVLHEAIRKGSMVLVKRLLAEHPDLARVPGIGTSPLYLAIFLGHTDIAEELHRTDNQLSFSGPDGQNALHIAVLRDTDMTKLLLEWNKDLTKQRDKNGSTPLHFSASWGRPETILLLEANPSSAYQPDITGSFPIHTAAWLGWHKTVISLLEKCPDCANLCDLRGRTFLHVAVEEESDNIVAYACRQPRFAHILNMQDFDGNTAIHLAVQAGNLPIFCSLLGNRQASLNIPNYNGQTARHLSDSMIPPGFFYNMITRKLIDGSLTYAHSFYGNYRADHFIQQYKNQKIDEAKESDKLKDSTQTLAIGSVLIATVTFGATFALPGGYKADDHINGGTPTLAGRFTFNAFIVANTLAFICSALSTMSLMYSGMAMVDLRVRRLHFNSSLSLVSGSLTSMAAAFALGVYTVLAPVAHITAITICVMVCAMTLYFEQVEILDTIIIARALSSRIGNRAVLRSATFIFGALLVDLWPLIPVFILAAISTKVQRK